MTWAEYCRTQLDTLQRKYPYKNILRPTTFTEKLHWLKVCDSTFLKTFCTDKITLREYANRVLHKNICIPLLKTWSNLNDFCLDSLPDEFVLKCNHGSGMNIFVNDRRRINITDVKKTLQSWLTKCPSDDYEMHYNLIPPKILAEEYKHEIGATSLIDYKLFMFNGVPKLWQVITNRNTHEEISHYDMDWSYSPQYDWADFPSVSTIHSPINMALMIDYAIKLARPFKFVRVDFYEVGDTVYLGEMTFTPASGTQRFKYSQADYALGEWLKI